jgi:cysteine desulfuration protein SufE
MVRENEQRLVEEIGPEGGPSECLQAIMDRVSPVAAVASAERTDATLVRGCATSVWIAGRVEEGAVRLAASATSPLVAGLVRLVCEIYDGTPAREARELEPELFSRLGLDRRLTPTRQRTVAVVRDRIRELAS